MSGQRGTDPREIGNGRVGPSYGLIRLDEHGDCPRAPGHHQAGEGAMKWGAGLADRGLLE